MDPPDDFQVRQFWATSIFSRLWPEHLAEAPAIIDLLYQIKSSHSQPIASGIATGAKSSQGLFESDFDLFARDDAPLRKLRSFVAQSVQMAVVQVNGSMIQPSRVQISILDSWFHVTNGGGFHDAHRHGGCSWCGIYYVQVGNSGHADGGAPNGVNRFYSPLPVGGAIRDFGNHYLDFNYVDVPLRDGLLVLFPSYLLHSGLPYRGEMDRIVISFNSQATLT